MPSKTYQNTQKKNGVTVLTSSRAMILELIRCYSVLEMECSLLEVQKLCWFLQRSIELNKLNNELKLDFKANYYGPYANNLQHLLNALDGSYIIAEKRISDSFPLDSIAFNYHKQDELKQYLTTQLTEYMPALQLATEAIDGFESPFGMELLSTVDWLIEKENCQPTLESIKQGIANWPAGEEWAKRKMRIFDDKSIKIALKRLEEFNLKMQV